MPEIIQLVADIGFTTTYEPVGEVKIEYVRGTSLVESNFAETCSIFSSMGYKVILI